MIEDSKIVQSIKVEIRCPSCGTIDSEVNYEVKDWIVGKCEYCGAKTIIVKETGNDRATSPAKTT